MNPDEAIKQLKPYIIGDLPAKEASILEGHIDVSPVAEWYHQRYYRQLLPVMKLGTSEPSEGVLDTLFARARQDMNDGTLEPTTRMHLVRGVSKYWKYAAALVVAFGVTAALVTSDPSRPVPQERTVAVAMIGDTGMVSTSKVSAGQEVRVPEGQNAVVTMIDGSRIQAIGGSAFTVRYADVAEAAEEHGEHAAPAGTMKVATIDLLHGQVFVEMDASARAKARKGDKLDRIEILGGTASLSLSSFESFSGTTVMPAATVAYDAPLYSVVQNAGSAAQNVELRRQSVADVLDLSSQLGVKIEYDEKVALMLEDESRVVSLVKSTLTRENFAAELARQCSITLVPTGPASYTLSAEGLGGGNGNDSQREYFDVSVLAGDCHLIGLDGSEEMVAVYPSSELLGKNADAYRSGGASFGYQMRSYIPTHGAASRNGLGSVPIEALFQVENNLVGRFMRLGAISQSKYASATLVSRMDNRAALNAKLGNAGTTLPVRNIESRDGAVWIQTGSEGMIYLPRDEATTVGGVRGKLVYWNNRSLVMQDADGKCHHISLQRTDG